MAYKSTVYRVKQHFLRYGMACVVRHAVRRSDESSTPPPLLKEHRFEQAGSGALASNFT